MAEKSVRKNTEVIERGNIFFFYRPKVQHETVSGLEDVERFYVVLGPGGKKVYRLINVGRKRMPDPETHQREWGFVEKVGRRPEDVEDELELETYGTKTRGERVREAARPAGEGVYALVRHEDHTHLAYALELPKRPKEVQKELNIEDEGSYIITIKNPDKPSPPGAGLTTKQKADFPWHLKKKFEGKRFIDVDDPEFLNYEGAEIIMIGARERPEEELGIRLNPQNETEATAEIFKDLHLEKDLHPTEPLFKGEWR